ncbi:MAG: type IV pilus secretin PilQ [Nitrospirae bacterium]|nr:type IV pilus secretin PilQ [Nitrospirota bacterium]
MMKLNWKLFCILNGVALFLVLCCMAWHVSAEVPEITGIDVREVNGSTEIQIEGNSPLNYTIYKPSDPYTIVVELHDVSAGKFKEKLIIDKAGVMEIIPTEVEGAAKTTRLEIVLTVPADVKPLQKVKALILTFLNPDAAVAEAQTPSLTPTTKEPRLLAKTGAEKTTETLNGTPSISVKDKYAGEKISLDFQDAELSHIFRLLAEVSGYNIVVSPEVKGKFSMKLLNVPWEQALNIILKNHALSKTVDGNIIRIVPTALLSREAEEISKVKEAEIKAGEIETRIYPINYADVDKVKGAIESAKVLTSIGNVSADKRTSTVIIKDVKGTHKEYEDIILSLDIPTPQVSIEAKIIEVTTSFTKEFGIQWGMSWKPPDERITIGGPSTPGGTGFSTGSPLMVNLPAAVGSGSGGAIGIGYITGTFKLDLQLSAMESSGKGNIISNPKITTMDNEKATIKQGKKIPYQTVSSEGTKVEFVDAQLELTVTPHITPDGTIVMDVEVKKNEADFAQTAGTGVPTIDTKEAKTRVLIKDGDTVVIGGILKTTTSKSTAGVPILSKIPVLGWLFKKEKGVEDTSELLIFITPRVVFK